MARFLSQVYTGIRGSVGGVTYLSNQYHQLIARARTAPVQPNTNNQGLVRGAFEDASSLWLSQSPANRLLWEAYADTVSYAGPLGPYTVPGRQVFIGTQGLRMYAASKGIAFLAGSETDPPDVPGVLSLGTITIDAPTPGNTGFVVAMTNRNAEDINLVAERSISFNATRLRYKGPWLSDTIVGEHLAPLATSSLAFTGLTLGMFYFIRVRAISYQHPFRLSAEAFIRCEAVAGA